MATNEVNSHKLGFALSFCFIIVIGAVYLIGGIVNERLPNVGSKVVSRLNLRSGRLQRVQSLPKATLCPQLPIQATR